MLEDSDRTDVADGAAAADVDDDFFSSFDKPVKRSNPPSRSTTPALRTGSPFLNAPANGSARSKSPLSVGGEGSAGAARAPVAAVRKTGAGPATGAAKKSSILGAKKTKLGAKKLDAGALDFDAAEREAQEHADRVAKLGYDPDAEKPPVNTAAAANQPNLQEPSTIASPVPVNPSRTANINENKSTGDVERLGMGVRKLGFGQVGGGGAAKSGGAAAPAKPKMGGFGSTSRAVEGKWTLEHIQRREIPETDT